jgi:hypothetical protein
MGAYEPHGPFDRFTLWSDPVRYHPGPEHRYAIQTANGNYLTAAAADGAAAVTRSTPTPPKSAGGRSSGS